MRGAQRTQSRKPPRTQSRTSSPEAEDAVGVGQQRVGRALARGGQAARGAGQQRRGAGAGEPRAVEVGARRWLQGRRPGGGGEGEGASVSERMGAPARRKSPKPKAPGRALTCGGQQQQRGGSHQGGRVAAGGSHGGGRSLGVLSLVARREGVGAWYPRCARNCAIGGIPGCWVREKRSAAAPKTLSIESVESFAPFERGGRGAKYHYELEALPFFLL